MNKEITHTKSTFKSTPSGVLNRLERLIQGLEENSKTRVNDIYPGHTMALIKSGINLKTPPTLEELWEYVYEQEKNTKEKE